MYCGSGSPSAAPLQSAQIITSQLLISYVSVGNGHFKSSIIRYNFCHVAFNFASLFDLILGYLESVI